MVFCHCASGGSTALSILLDDCERKEEQEIIARWEREFGVRAEVVRYSESAYARLLVERTSAG